jgi:hypothetical protein
VIKKLLPSGSLIANRKGSVTGFIGPVSRLWRHKCL